MTALSESFYLTSIHNVFSWLISTLLLFSQIRKPILDTFIENPELFPEDSDLEEDLEKIQQEVDVCIAAVRVHNERKWLEWEDQQQKEEEEWRKWEEEEEWKKKEEEYQKREEADKDAYEEKLTKACKTQSKVSWEVSISCRG